MISPAKPSLSEKGETSKKETSRYRLDSLDLLRGVIMVLMALDHTRDYFTAGTANPRDVHVPALFLTRWITHFCASNFVFLAGIGAFLYSTRAPDLRAVRTFLFTRGLWLVFLEFTLVRIGFSFSLWPDMVMLQVIWAIGISMMILSALISLPRAIIGSIALGLIFGHNLFDSVQPQSFGQFHWVWSLLHRPTQLELSPSIKVFAFYPLIPWVGVLAAGYAFGATFVLEQQQRRRVLLGCGFGMIALFVLLRASGAYGDPVPWSRQDSWSATLLAFINCEKYPPSLLFLCMTIGPALLSLAAFEELKGKWTSFFITFGRVPLFYYLAHIYLIHTLAVGLALVRQLNIGWQFHGLPPMSNPPGWDLSLPAVYGLWAAIVLLLYIPCRWFQGVKERNRSWWLSYL